MKEHRRGKNSGNQSEVSKMEVTKPQNKLRILPTDAEEEEGGLKKLVEQKYQSKSEKKVVERRAVSEQMENQSEHKAVTFKIVRYSKDYPETLE